MDELFVKLTNKDFIALYAPPSMVQDIINYVQMNKDNIMNSFYFTIEYDMKHSISSPDLMSKFCVDVIKNAIKILNDGTQNQPPRYTSIYTSAGNSHFYHPEYLLVNINKPSWVKEETSLEDYWDYWNVYQRNCNGSRFLPLYVAGHRRPMDKTPYPNSIELIQEPRHYFNNYRVDHMFNNVSDRMLH